MSGGLDEEVRLDRDTVWLSQEQIAALFDVQKAAVSKHLKNIFASGEQARAATVSKVETVQHEGAHMRCGRSIGANLPSFFIFKTTSQTEYPANQVR